MKKQTKTIIAVGLIAVAGYVVYKNFIQQPNTNQNMLPGGPGYTPAPPAPTPWWSQLLGAWATSSQAYGASGGYQGGGQGSVGASTYRQNYMY